MKEILEFIFQDFWHFAGMWILLDAVFGNGIIHLLRIDFSRKRKE